MKNILIVKTSSLGDIIHTYPVVDYLHWKFPEAHIGWVVEAPCAELVQNHPFVNQAIIIATRAWRKAAFKSDTLKAIWKTHARLRDITYDVVFDLQGNVKSGLIVSQAKSQHKVGFGAASVAEWPNLLCTNQRFNPPPHGNIRQDYLALTAAFFGDPLPLESGQTVLKLSAAQQSQLQALLALPVLQPGPKVLVCPGSAWRNKQLNPESLAAFLHLLQKELRCAFLFAWGSTEEQAIAQRLHEQFASSVVVDRLPLSMLQNLMAGCRLVIAMDSLPLHLAGTTATPSFSVFGASSAAKYKPIGAQHAAFQGACPYGRIFTKRCPVLRTCQTGACIRNLQAEELFAHFNSWWQAQ